MKQLIVCAAVLPLMLAFVMQFMLMEERYAAVTRSEGAVRTAAAKASYEGGFSADNEARMRAEIASAFQIDAGAIYMDIDRKLGAGGETIYYNIRIPSGKLIAAPRVFGISENSNSKTFDIRGESPNLLFLTQQKEDAEIDAKDDVTNA